MPKTDFDQLLHRYLTNQVSELEKNKIEAWLEVKKTDKSIADVLTPEEEDILFKKISSNIDNIDEIIAFRPTGQNNQSIFFNRSFRIAASILLLVTISVVIVTLTKRNNSANEISQNDNTEKIILNDGTIVWLQKGSRLSYAEDNKAGTRNATLVGGGLFEVSKDASRPFIIACNGITAKVLGTSFSIMTSDDGIELKVLTGKVNLSSMVDQRGIDVAPYEAVVFRKSGASEKATLAQAEIDRLTENTGYQMKFDDKPMSDVFKKIEEKFSVNVAIEQSNINKCKITADFTDRSLETTMTMLAASLELRFTISGKTVSVSGRGCK